MQILVAILIAVAAVANLLPVSGVVSASQLQTLYGIPFHADNLLILMRHRAVLFGVVGGLLAGAVFYSPLRPVAIAAGLVSMLSFLVIVWIVGGANAELRRVVVVDIVATVALVAAALLDRFARE